MSTTPLTQQQREKNTDLLVETSENGDLEEVKRLIPLSNPKANMSLALRLAANNGHTECVKLLIPVSDSRWDNSQALRCAAQNEHTEVVKLLIPVSDCSLVVDIMAEEHQDTTLLQQCIDEHEALQQQQRLHTTLQDINNELVVAKRKI